MRRILNLILAITVTMATTGAAQASLQSNWPLLAFDRANGCELEVVGNGRFIEARADGLIPGEAMRFTLGNGDMKPITWQVYATSNGHWSKLYVPFRFGQPGGTVTVQIEAARCDLSASVPWQRGVRVID